MPMAFTVRDVMDTDVYTVEADEPVKKALDTMLEKGVWSVVITDKGLPVGVITDRDILRRCIGKGLDLEKTTCREIMSSPLITISPDATLGEAWSLLSETKVRRAYVIEKGKIIGRVTQTGLFNKLLELVLALSSVRYQL